MKQITAIINVPDDETEDMFKQVMAHVGYELEECIFDSPATNNEPKWHPGQEENELKWHPEIEPKPIQATVGTLGGICCNESYCIYRRDCANHASAGEFRSEDGFSPELVLLDNGIGCRTINTPSFDDEEYHMSETLPENYKSLGQGEMYLSDGKIVRYNRDRYR